MNVEAMTWPNWLPRVLWIRRMCPRCKSLQFKPSCVRSMGFLACLPCAPFVVNSAGGGTTGSHCETQNERPELQLRSHVQ